MKNQIMDQISAILEKTESRDLNGLTVVFLNPETKDPRSEILGGFGIWDGEIKLFVECDPDDCGEGKRRFEGAKPFTLVKLAKSPGYWCPCGSSWCWVPG